MSTPVIIGLAAVSFTKAFWAFKENEYRARARQLSALGRKLGFRVIALPKSLNDAARAEQAAKAFNRQADFVILDLATFPEGKITEAFCDALDRPLALWSRNEATHGGNIGHNSFCGANFLAGNLALRRRRFRAFYGPVDDPEFKARLQTAVKLIRAAKLSAGARIGMIGEKIVPKFHDIDIQPDDRARLEKRWGITFMGIPFDELIREANALEAGVVSKETRRHVPRFAEIRIDREAVDKMTRLFIVTRTLMARHNLAAAAFRCWPEMASHYGAWPCATLSLLNEAGFPVACEGDPAGALDMLLADRLSPKPSTLLDIVDWDDKAQTFSIWHCGPTALSWADRAGAALLPHNVDGATKAGRPNFGQPCIVDMAFAPAPVTVFRTLGALDDEFAVQGRLVPARNRKICGSFGLVSKARMYGRPTPVNFIRSSIFDRGLPHHFAAVRGHVL